MSRPPFVKIWVVLAALTCAAAAARSVRDGVYSKDQAARGQTVYREECAKCHGPTLTGGEDAPALVGDEFIAKWKGRSANDLFELTRKTMPFEDPGSLSRRQYADLVAYILSANEYPAGAKDLESTAEALGDIRIEPRK